jgi:erythromycin esterase
VISFAAERTDGELDALGRALADVQIVLLGENGHGVKEFTESKVKLIEWLHREHGFELVVFESGLFECDRAWRHLARMEAADALKACLRYPSEHAELLPLFELMQAKRGSAEPLAVSGMDFQSQGFDSELRPVETFERLHDADSALARRLARTDSGLYLVPQHGGLGDSIYEYAYRNAERLKADYHRAAELTSGTTSLVFRLAVGWIDRLAMRGEAEVRGDGRLPGRYFELRDEWMARAVSALADSTGPRRKVVVWLHNDHARYGRFPAASSDSIRSTGGYLRDWYGGRVFSVGFFMRRGSVADNARRPRAMAPIPSDGLEAYLSRGPVTYLVLRSNRNPEVMRWANAEQPYLRMGLDTLSLTPAREFDALIFVDSVSVPTYQIP